LEVLIVAFVVLVFFRRKNVGRKKIDCTLVKVKESKTIANCMRVKPNSKEKINDV
jgi:hypothetical protein